MEQKAQGAIEYLLIIGAAVLVVAIVITVVISMLQQGKVQGGQANNDYNSQMTDLNQLKKQ